MVKLNMVNHLESFVVHLSVALGMLIKLVARVLWLAAIYHPLCIVFSLLVGVVIAYDQATLLVQTRPYHGRGALCYA